MSDQIGTLIQADFSQVPDVVKPVLPGIKDFLIDDVTTKAPKNPESKGVSVVVKLTVHNECPDKGRQMTDYIWISSDPSLSAEERARNLVGIKRLALAAGVPLGANGLNLLELKGKIVKALVEPDVFKDTTTGVTKETSRVKKYFIPGDPEMTTSSGVTA